MCIRDRVSDACLASISAKTSIIRTPRPPSRSSGAAGTFQMCIRDRRYPGRGIAFAIPITGIGLRWHKLLTAADEEQKEVSRMHETEKNDGFDAVSYTHLDVYKRQA